MWIMWQTMISDLPGGVVTESHSMERVVTVSGDAVKEPGNFQVLLVA
ncbi:MAG: hypothetical protein ACLRUZ_11785 [Faecalimonas sp.]